MICKQGDQIFSHVFSSGQAKPESTAAHWQKILTKHEGKTAQKVVVKRY